MSHPKIIQGGMGVAVSGWPLARAVAKTGQLGVVSGTMLPVILARRLQLGDPDGNLRRALCSFPVPGVAERLLEKFFIPGGKAPGAPFKQAPMPTLKPSAEFLELTVAANFVEVFLAKEGHNGLVGINLLEKIQLVTLPSLYGAMLAGVDYVLMGAGIPRAIPDVLDRFAAGEAVEMRIDVEGAEPDEEFLSTFDPRGFCGGEAVRLRRPLFLPIVSSATLAMTLARKSRGRVDGFVVEGELAGGHNAPPRGPMQLSVSGEPVYGPRDLPDLEKFRALGLPFWLAGAYARPEKLAEALRVGAAGIQVGTAFAFCEESGIEAGLRRRAVELSRAGRAVVFTDPSASPTGFPFKVMQMEGTVSDADDYAGRKRICDLGYLRQVFRKPDGTLGYRCPSEEVADYVRKGGSLEDTQGRKCLCNGLTSTVGLGQIRAGSQTELAIVTAGNDVVSIGRFAGPDGWSYTAADVIRCLLAEGDAASKVGKPDA
ncbi:MAG: nitronate monooxygenase [Opitutaceae bacterium]|nr:nitronate monooxygenase [Opitutaceae bacterium]